MRALVLSATAVGSALLMAVPVATQAPRTIRGLPTVVVGGREAVEGEILIKYREGAAAAARTRVESLAAADRSEAVGRLGVRRLHSRRYNTAALLASLRGQPQVEYAEPNYIIRAFPIPQGAPVVQGVVPNDTYFSLLWGLQNTGQTIPPISGVPGTSGADISATAVWGATTGSHANVVGVIDTGIDYAHPDLAANIWSAPSGFTVTIGATPVTCLAGTHGFNAITKTCNPMDDHGHGTHVSGTIGAIGNNAAGVVGVNWTASMMGIKFMDSTGNGLTSDAINAIEFAIQAKAAFAGTSGANVRVLNASWGGPGFSQALLDEINAANANGMLFVAAAGNDGQDNDVTPSYPASYTAPNIVAVAATNNTDGRPSFSNYGHSSVHLGAPGDSIVSTYLGSPYAYMSGTSMATAHVSGAAALVLSACSLTTASLRSALLNNIDPIASLSGVTTTGGRLNVNKAVLSCARPTITTQPQGQVIASGQTASLSVVALGATPLSYQWYVGTSGATGNPVAGATSSVYTTPALTSTTNYWARVSNAYGTADSSTATITIAAVPSIPAAGQPQSQTIQTGNTASLSVGASGAALTYQWYVGATGVTSSPIPGATSASYTTPVLVSTTNYWVRVSNVAGSADSITATIRVVLYRPFTDDVLTPGSSVIRAVHITELRTRIDAQRARFGLAVYPWTDPTLATGVTLVRAQHITELRAALSQVYAAARLVPPVFTDPSLAPGTAIKAVHIAELRAAVIALE